MFGKVVQIENLKIMVMCIPSTPLSEILARAAAKVAAWEDEANHKSHAREIASRFGIELAVTND